MTSEVFRAADKDLSSNNKLVADAVTALTLFLGLQLAVPSVLRLPALGAIGYPAAFWVVCLGLWWCSARFRVGLYGKPSFNPVKVASFALLASVVLSYASAMRRPLPPLESNQADLGIARILVALSLVLIATDGVMNWKRLITLLRRIGLAGGLFALLGLIQFFTNRSWIEWISIPGFARSDDYSAVVERAGFTRPTATAMHPLEYASTLSVFFPIALTLAIHDKGKPAVVRWSIVWTILIALIVSGSRSSFLGLMVSLLVLAFSWPAVTRLRIFAALLAVVILVFLTVPGMVGTIRGLFIYVEDDPSTLSRTAGYEMSWEFIARSPLIGRGFGTFLTSYRILDNQVLLILVEIGIVGFAVFATLIGAAAFSPLIARRGLPAGLPRDISFGITASVVAGASLMFFFDTFAFPIAFGTWFLAVGAAGAYWNLAHQEQLQADVDTV